MFCILSCVVLLILVYYTVVKPARYWKEQGIPYVPGWPIIGNMQDIILRRKHFVYFFIDLYNKFPRERYMGYMQFNKKFLLVRDLELIKQMGVKQFSHFHDHQLFIDPNSDALMSKALMNLTGEEWKTMRSTLSPAFTSSKMRNMYLLMKDCAENFANNFTDKKEVSLEMEDIFIKYATDVIATTAFGIQTDSVREPNNEFFTTSKCLFQMGFVQVIKFFAFQILPASVIKLLKLQFFPNNVTDFFRRIVKENISKREAEGIVRLDMIHLLMEARRGQLKHDQVNEANDTGFATVEESHFGRTSERFELTDDHIVAQALLFFFASLATSSSAATFMAYELAVHPEIQKTLQEEIDEAVTKSNGNVSYDTLLSLKYLDQVVSESLRLWSPGFVADRLCAKDFLIEPINQNEKSFVVEKGVNVAFPIIAIHRDPKYFPEPERFDPERFNEENRNKIVPGSYMPFGLGPRNCIGSRFALLQVKTLLLNLLSKFDIVPVNKTKIPIEIDSSKLQFNVKGGLWLGLKTRKVTEI